MPDPINPLLQNARREALVVLLIWLVTLVWTVGGSYALGYGQPPEQIRVIMGVPEWIAFGVLAPWMFSTAATIWFGFFFMKDDDLGVEKEEAGDGQA